MCKYEFEPFGLSYENGRMHHVNDHGGGMKLFGISISNTKVVSDEMIPRPRTELKNVLLASTRMKIERIGSVCQRMNQKALVQIQDPSRGFTTAVHMLDNNPRDEHVAAPPSGLRFL
jgi:hypothetical protein